RSGSRFPVCLAHAGISAHQSSERDGFRRGKGCIPSGAMFHSFDGLSIAVLVLIGRSLLHKLVAGVRLLTLADPGKVLLRNSPAQIECCSKSALPFARNFALLRPVVLLARREFLLVITLGLAGRKRLGNGQHCRLLHLDSQTVDWSILSDCLSGNVLRPCFFYFVRHDKIVHGSFNKSRVPFFER